MSQEEGHWDSWGLEHLTCKMSLEKWGAVCSAIKRAIANRTEPSFSQRCTAKDGEHISLQGKFWSGVKERMIVLVRVVKCWNMCPESLWCLHPGDIHRRL